MRLIEIQQRDTFITTGRDQSAHESSARAFHILEKTKDYLARGVPPDVMLELIDEMETVFPE